MNTPVKPYQISSKSGYSLLELTIVAAIIGLLSLVAVPNIVGRMPEKRLERAAWKVCSDLRHARMQAVSENTTVQVQFNNSTEAYTIWVDSDKDGTEDTDEKTVVSLDDIPGVDLYTYPETGTFKPRGDVETSYHYWFVRLMNPEVGYRYIYVFPNGQIDPYNF